MKGAIRSRSQGVLLTAAGVILATFQLLMFDHAVATSSAGFTDELANDTTVFSPLIDETILIVVVALVCSGTYLILWNVRRRWLRLVICFVSGLFAWCAFFFIELAIQGHLSGFSPGP